MDVLTATVIKCDPNPNVTQVLKGMLTEINENTNDLSKEESVFVKVFNTTQPLSCTPTLRTQTQREKL